jgi:Tol biopolymer transport system component
MVSSGLSEWLIAPRLFIGGVCVLLTAGCGDGTGPTPTPSPLANRLVFQSNRAGPFELYSMKLDGSDVSRLISDGDQYLDPAVSPDGQHIAFTRPGSATRIYVMNADGTGATPITSGLDDQGLPTFDVGAAWSPDGSRIVFTSFRTGCEQLFTMKADGTEPVQLTPCQGADLDPAWSPDGRSIAFARAEGPSRRDIWIVTPTGTGATNITNDGDVAADAVPAWSPDSRRIFWATSRADTNHYQIWSMNRDGSDAKQVTNEPTGAFSPAVSPDGTRLAYTAFNGDQDDIWVAQADGTGALQLTTTEAKDQVAVWGPAP